ncbi:hypothetical protein [Amycolatopsis thermoflava]|uniref:hypothetical protein n=1 Tax=Amycolatopsis thermoflava TaxID=84480 RepID=UPI0037FEE866
MCILDQDATVLSAITGLVDKSIISRAETNRPHTRYRMLEPVRQFAAERLSSGPDGPEAHRRHRDCYLRLAGRSRNDYCSSRNIHQALAFSLSDAHEPEVAVEMAASLRPFWQQSGSILEGYKWLRRALDQTSGPSRPRAAGLASAGILGFLLEEGDAARKLLEEHNALAAGEGYHEFTPLVHFASALEAVADGDLAAALDRAERAVTTGLELDDPATAAEAMALSALCVFILDHERAEELTTRFLEFAEARRAHLMKAIALYPLGAVRWHNGDTTTATALMREAIRLYQMFEHPGMVAVCIEGLAWSTPEDDPEGAATLLGAAKSVWKYSQMRIPETAVQRVGRTVETRLRQRLGDLCFE